MLALRRVLLHESSLHFGGWGVVEVARGSERSLENVADHVSVAADSARNIANGQLLDLVILCVKLSQSIRVFSLGSNSIQQHYLLPEDIKIDVDVFLCLLDVVQQTLHFLWK